jgi:hypothetical protein
MENILGNVGLWVNAFPVTHQEAYRFLILHTLNLCHAISELHSITTQETILLMAATTKSWIPAKKLLIAL